MDRTQANEVAASMALALSKIGDGRWNFTIDLRGGARGVPRYIVLAIGGGDNTRISATAPDEYWIDVPDYPGLLSEPADSLPALIVAAAAALEAIAVDAAEASHYLRNMLKEKK